ncbi:hypothetical protein pb186bvf_020298 [Paramecium bursaria]
MINQQGQEHFLIASKVYKQRFFQFLKDINNIQGLKSVRVAKQVLNLLPKIKKLQDSETLIFYCDFLISISRLLEAYSLNSFGQRRFKQVTNFHEFIEIRFNDFINAFNKNWQVKPFEQFEVLEQAKVNIKENLDIVKQIVQSEINEDQIDQYFQQIQVYNFTANNTVIGISSFDVKDLFYLLLKNYKINYGQYLLLVNKKHQPLFNYGRCQFKFSSYEYINRGW